MREFFYYTKAERIGIVVLILLCLLLVVVPSFFPDRAADQLGDPAEMEAIVEKWALGEESASSAEPTDESPQALVPFDPNQATRDVLEAAQLPQRTIRAWLSYTGKGGRWTSTDDLRRFRALAAEDLERIQPLLRFPAEGSPAASSPQTEVPQLFPFDPNTVTEKELLTLGVPAKVARTWVKYTQNGGRFREARDIERVYGLSDQAVEQLLPYVQVPEAEEGHDRPGDQEPEGREEPKPAAAPLRIDINQAGPEEWQQLRGIGPKLSSRIVRFRDKLGGFISIDQVGETYGLPDSTFQRIRTQLQASPIQPSLRVNVLNKQGLGSHPYISYQEAEVLINYRSKHGPFQNVEDLRQVIALKKETLEKITPYLSFE